MCSDLLVFSYIAMSHRAHSHFKCNREALAEDFAWSSVAEAFTGSVVEYVADVFHFQRTDAREVRPFGKVLP